MYSRPYNAKSASTEVHNKPSRCANSSLEHPFNCKGCSKFPIKPQFSNSYAKFDSTLPEKKV